MSNAVFSDVFVYTKPGPAGELSAAIDYAFSMRAADAAHVTFLLMAHKFDPPYALAHEFVGTLAASADNEEKKQLAKAEATLRGRLPLDSGRYTVMTDQLSLGAALATAARHARLHNVSMIDRPDDYLALGASAFEELLFHSGRPVIVTPPNAREFRADRILIAWDGTTKSSRALHDALPLLKQASHVEVVSVVGEKDLRELPAGVDCAAHLARNDVIAEVVGLDAAGRSVGAVLRERAEIAGIDLIVMGAFAHSRLRQLFFGGVTDNMAREATVPVFMST